MTKAQKIKLHTAMLSDNEHRCNSLNNYIHTDEYLTAEVVKVVEEIINEETKVLQEEVKEYESEAREVNIRMHKYVTETVPKLTKAKNIIHKLLILINDRHWWNYQTIDEARFFMKE